MDFDRNKMDFREADRAFEELARRRDAGGIGAEEFDAERQRLMVLDGEGRWWAKSGETGEWNYHDGKSWVVGTPPGYEPDTKDVGDPVEDERDKEVTWNNGGVSVSSRDETAFRWPMLALAAVVFLAIGGTFFFLTRGVDQSIRASEGVANGVEVPSLVGAASVEEARQAVGEDFEVVEGGQVESRQPVGSVIEQDTEPGETLEVGAIISVKISKGVEVLEVIGNDRDSAVELLEGRLFDVTVDTKESPDYREGKVISQKPGGGEFAESGSAVSLTVGSGESPGSDAPVYADSGGSEEAAGQDLRVAVPDIVGEYAEDGKRELEDAGFDHEVEYVESEEEAGIIVSTDPEAGTLLDPATSPVTVVQSSEPPGGGDGSDGGAAGEQYVPPEYPAPNHTE